MKQRQLMDEAQMQRTLKRLAHEIIERDPQSSAFILVGIERRGMPLAQCLREQLESLTSAQVSIETLNIEFYRDDRKKKSEDPIVHPPSFSQSLEDATVILVDDVLFTGRTAHAAMEAILHVARPRAIRLAILVDRGHRELPVRADFVGKNVPSSLQETIAVHIPPYEEDCSVWIIEGAS